MQRFKLLLGNPLQLIAQFTVVLGSAIAGMVTEEQLADGIIIPSALDKNVAEAVACAVEACVKA